MDEATRSRPNLLDVCTAQDQLLRNVEALAKGWRKSTNPARQADATALLQLVRGQ